MTAAERASLRPGFLEAVRPALCAEELDGWLLYDLEGHNRVAGEILGLEAGLSRRWFVFVVPEGPPVALVHRIELQPWEGWEGRVRTYVGWREMEEHLAEMLGARGRVAMEFSPRDHVPFVDRVPAGIVQLVEEIGPRVVTSSGLIALTCARWSETGRELHTRAGEALAVIARRAFQHAAGEIRGDRALTEHDLLREIESRIARAGVGEGGVIVAAGPDTALPHYAPPPEGSRTLRRGDVLLIDLWGRVTDEPEAVFADQTWMGVLGPEAAAPEGFPEAWEAVRDARDGAVELIREAAGGGPAGDGERRAGPGGEARLPTGADVDLRTRRILEERGYGEAILHRTGHAIDTVNHGFGPNLDAVETRDERRLVEGIGFSVEPGVYLEGRWGIRSEINVHLGPDGPEVTTPDVQDAFWSEP